MEQRQCAGLDVSLETTSVCVVDEAGAVVWRGKCALEPGVIAETLAKRAPGAVRAGLETGQLSNCLTLGLRRRGVAVVCMDARHAKAAPSLQINKTDANDALSLAQVVRTGCGDQGELGGFAGGLQAFVQVDEGTLPGHHGAQRRRHSSSAR